MEVLATRLKWLRNKKRYSQKDIATMIGMTPSGYQKVELNQRDPKLDVLLKLCDIFNVSTDFLLGRDNFTEELTDTHVRISSCQIQLRNLKEIYSEYMVKENEVRSIIHHLEKSLFEEVDALKKEAIKSKLTMQQYLLDRTNIDRTETEHEIHTLNKELSEHLYKYLSAIIELPESNPSEDKLIEDYLPMNIEIQPDIFDHFSLHLSLRGVGFIGHYGDYKTIEQAKEERDKLNRMFND